MFSRKKTHIHTSILNYYNSQLKFQWKKFACKGNNSVIVNKINYLRKFIILFPLNYQGDGGAVHCMGYIHTKNENLLSLLYVLKICSYSYNRVYVCMCVIYLQFKRTLQKNVSKQQNKTAFATQLNIFLLRFWTSQFYGTERERELIMGHN